MGTFQTFRIMHFIDCGELLVNILKLLNICVGHICSGKVLGKGVTEAGQS